VIWAVNTHWCPLFYYYSNIILLCAIFTHFSICVIITCAILHAPVLPKIIVSFNKQVLPTPNWQSRVLVPSNTTYPCEVGFSSIQRKEKLTKPAEWLKMGLVKHRARLKSIINWSHNIDNLIALCFIAWKEWWWYYYYDKYIICKHSRIKYHI